MIGRGGNNGPMGANTLLCVGEARELEGRGLINELRLGFVCLPTLEDVIGDETSGEKELLNGDAFLVRSPSEVDGVTSTSWLGGKKLIKDSALLLGSSVAGGESWLGRKVLVYGSTPLLKPAHAVDCLAGRYTLLGKESM